MLDDDLPSQERRGAQVVMTVYEVDMKTGESKPAPGYDPDDKCACGHTRRAHLQSYDGGSGRGGCSGWSHGINSMCLCDEFEMLVANESPSVVPTECKASQVEIDGLDVHRWRLRALDAEQRNSNIGNMFYQLRARVLNLLEEQIAAATMLRDEILRTTRE